MANTFDRREMSWLEFLDTAKANGVSAAYADANTARGDFTQGVSFNQALEMGYGDGWVPQSPNVADLLSKVETDLGDAMRPSFEFYFDTSGMEVDIARYLSNEPECMLQALPTKVMRTGRIIRLYVPATYSGGTDSNQIIARGIAIMALVEAFSMMRHPVEVVAGICNHGEGRYSRLRTAYLVTVQQATEMLDMSRIMFALAHPAFARQLGWAVKETCPRANDMGFYGGGGYGNPSREIIPEDYEGLAVENVIVLPSIDSDSFDWTNETKVVAWIKGQLKRIEDNAI